MNTDKHRFYIRKGFKDKRLNGTRMNTDKNVKTSGAIGVFICAHFSIPHSEFISFD
jgi:hypothetical protein